MYTTIDDKAKAIMSNSGLKIIPILSNNYKEVFHGDAVHRIINDPVKKERLISDIIKVLQKNNFSGINIDFEDLEEKKNESLVSFQRELYEKFARKRSAGNPGCGALQ